MDRQSGLGFIIFCCMILPFGENVLSPEKALPDTTMAVLAGVLGFASMRLFRVLQ